MRYSHAYDKFTYEIGTYEIFTYAIFTYAPCKWVLGVGGDYKFKLRIFY